MSDLRDACFYQGLALFGSGVAFGIACLSFINNGRTFDVVWLLLIAGLIFWNAWRFYDLTRQIVEPAPSSGTKAR